MERSLLSPNLIPLLSACFLIAYSYAPVLSTPAHLGIHPLDEKYFASEVIKCKDGSKSFTRDRINDNFCDCVDGTDEPGTSACPTGKFYCRNLGSAPRFLFSSRVNDRICDTWLMWPCGQQPECLRSFFFNGLPCELPHDCCDGSDEYDGSANCPNTCVMGGNVVYEMDTHSSTISALDSVDNKEMKSRISLEDLIQKLKGLKIVIILQVVLISFLVAFRLFRRRVRSKRRRYH